MVFSLSFFCLIMWKLSYAAVQQWKSALMMLSNRPNMWFDQTEKKIYISNVIFELEVSFFCYSDPLWGQLKNNKTVNIWLHACYIKSFKLDFQSTIKNVFTVLIRQRCRHLKMRLYKIKVHKIKWNKHFKHYKTKHYKLNTLGKVWWRKNFL